jgi:hypothetical protein
VTENYSGMTVNERLYAAGLIEAFDAATACQNRTKIVQILYGVGLTRDDVEKIADLTTSVPLENDGQT